MLGVCIFSQSRKHIYKNHIGAYHLTITYLSPQSLNRELRGVVDPSVNTPVLPGDPFVPDSCDIDTVTVLEALGSIFLFLFLNCEILILTL